MGRFREALAKKGNKNLISLKRSFALADADASGSLSLIEFEAVVRDQNIPGFTVNDAERVFKLFDSNSDGEIHFNEIMDALCGDFPESRRRIVSEAFDKLDTNKSGSLELEEVKGKFDATRHPEVITGKQNAEVIQAQFYDMFGTFHAASTNFDKDVPLSRELFSQYFHYISAQFDKEYEFRNFVVGVWNMDINPVGPKEFAGKHPSSYGKNSREQWKLANHKSIFGGRDADTPYKFSEEQLRKGADVKDVGQGSARAMMPAAGSKQWNISKTKGTDMHGDLQNRRESAMAKSNAPEYPPKMTDQEAENAKLLEGVRSRIKERGARGIIGIGRSFKIIDDDRSGSLNRAEFCKCLRDYRISDDEAEQEAIFSLIDRD